MVPKMRDLEASKSPSLQGLRTVRPFGWPFMDYTDCGIKGAFLKWTITVRGQATVSHTSPFHISFDFFSTLWLQCLALSTSFTFAVLSYGTIAECQVFVRVANQQDEN
jgi:hypothetical protein